jgi:hypothetical protein
MCVKAIGVRAFVKQAVCVPASVATQSSAVKTALLHVQSAAHAISDVEQACSRQVQIGLKVLVATLASASGTQVDASGEPESSGVLLFAGGELEELQPKPMMPAPAIAAAAIPTT